MSFLAGTRPIEDCVNPPLDPATLLDLSAEDLERAITQTEFGLGLCERRLDWNERRKSWAQKVIARNERQIQNINEWLDNPVVLAARALIEQGLGNPRHKRIIEAKIERLENARAELDQTEEQLMAIEMDTDAAEGLILGLSSTLEQMLAARK